jgi:hypothetical protein
MGQQEFSHFASLVKGQSGVGTLDSTAFVYPFIPKYSLAFLSGT